MRKWINLDRKKQESLKLLFPNLLGVNRCDENHGYEKIAISIFDHWLSNDEGNLLLQNVSKEEQKRRDNLHFLFNKSLVADTETYTFSFKGKWSKKHPVFKSFRDTKYLHEYVKPNDNYISSRFYFRLALPEMNALYFEGSDDTNYLYFKDKSLLADFLKLVEASGLYVLE